MRIEAVPLPEGLGLRVWHAVGLLVENASHQFGPGIIAGPPSAFLLWIFVIGRGAAFLQDSWSERFCFFPMIHVC
jgi:hypothetical protein